MGCHVRCIWVSGPAHCPPPESLLASGDQAAYLAGDLQSPEGVEIANKFYITSPDAEDLQIGQKVRLMELYNIKILEIRYENNKKVLIGSYEGDRVIQNMKKIQWVAENDAVEFSVKVPKELFIGDKYNPNSLELKTGYAESLVSKLKAGTLVQFIRFGFCSLLNGKSATYTHR